LFLEQKIAKEVLLPLKHPDIFLILKESFVDEIKRLFKENGIDLDEKWFWQDE
jgi:hypothetical protein